MDIKPGDIILCIDISAYGNGNKPPLRKNIEYIANSLKTCSCGSTHVDVGLNSNNTWQCQCGRYCSDGIWWCNTKRFVKKKSSREEASVKNVKFNKKLIEEPLYSEN